MRKIFANRACGILYRFVKQNGGRYLLPANVCPVVPLTFRLAEVGFDFVDIDADTLCIGEQACLSMIEDGGYNGLLFVHTYGTDYNPQPFFRQLKDRQPNIHIVDDKCLCAPDFTILQTEADLTMFSTGYAKYVDLGGGGFGFLKDNLDLSLAPLRFDGSEIEPVYKEAFAKKEKIAHVPSGWLDTFVFDQSTDEYCQHIEYERSRMIMHKKEINAIYREHLDKVKALDDDFNQWRFNILVENKQCLLKKLFDAGLFASSHYQPSSALFVDDHFPVAEYLYEHIVNLFNDRYITREQAERIVRIVRDSLMDRA